MILPQQPTPSTPARQMPPLTPPRKPIRCTLALVLIFISLTKKPLTFLLGFLLIGACILNFWDILSIYKTGDFTTTPSFPVWGFIMMLALMIPFVLLMSHLQRPKSHGSARFASFAELHAARMTLPANPKESYLPLGTCRNIVDIGISERWQQSHVLLIAPTGKRKTSGIIIPGLLSEQGKRSVIINDVKGELIEKTAGALALSHHCLMFCPTRPERSHQYNPLMHITTLEDAQDFAHCWVTNTGTSQDNSFWDRAATQLIMATVLHLRSAEPHAPLSRLATLLCSMQLDEIQHLLLNSPSKEAQSVTRGFMHSLMLNPKLGGSITIEVSSRLFTLMSADVQTVTARNDLDFHALVETPTALFLSIPASEKERLRPLSACLMMQLMKKLTKQAESNGGTLSRNVAFYLDEFANIGTIPHFLEHISLVRSAGIAFLMAIQDFGQLKRLYGDDGFTTILANSTTQIVFPGCGPQETQHYSTLLGQTTISTTSRSHGIDPFASSRTTITTNATARSLMTAEELRTMTLGNLVVVSDTMKPFLVRNRTYLERPEMKAYRATRPHSYCTPR